jgi:hypothetical protein
MAQGKGHCVTALIDDRSRPTLREQIGQLLTSCTTADIAVGHVRLAALDLTPAETRGLRRCRMLLGRLDASALSDFGYPDDRVDAHMQTLRAFLESGRVEIRSAGLSAWSPDFSVYRGMRDGGSICLMGAHYFRDPVAVNGPSFTAMLTDVMSVTAAVARFDALWDRSHDVIEPVLTAVHRRQSFCAM